jgi:hypothetical protein
MRQRWEGPWSGLETSDSPGLPAAKWQGDDKGMTRIFIEGE